MFSFWVIFLTISLSFVRGESGYSVPEPVFEVFSPNGLRISIPDSSDVRSVQFFLSFTKPVSKGDAGQLSQAVDKSEDGYWVYWNPDVSVGLNSIIYYRIVVKTKDSYSTKEGQYRVDKAISLYKNEEEVTDCPEAQGGQVQLPASFPRPQIDLEESNLGKLTGAGKKSAYKSSYSMYKSSDVKPITRSSTSTTSGTFFIKPSGVVEASGYKTQSSYDSTRREGEQWQHSESQLSAAEIEELKRLHGSSFQTLFGSEALRPSGSHHFEEKYYKESKNVHDGPVHYRYVETPSRYQQSYYKESSSTQTKPLTFDHSYLDSVSANRFSGSRYSESGSSIPKPVEQGSLIHKSEFQTQEKLTPIVPLPQQQDRDFEFSRHESRKVVSSVPTFPSPEIAAISKNSDSNFEFSRQETRKVVSSNHDVQPLAFNSGSLTANDRSYYTGSIFLAYRPSKPTNPQECTLVPDIDYKPKGNLREVEKSVNELSCLASLAEASIKEEFRLVKQQNSELRRKLELVELEVKRLSDDCQCLEKAN